MKIKELSKKELIELLTLLCRRNKDYYGFYDTVNRFIQQKWSDLNDKLIEQSNKCNILTESGYNRWKAINEKINELQSPQMVEYYCTLDDLK